MDNEKKTDEQTNERTKIWVVRKPGLEKTVSDNFCYANGCLTTKLVILGSITKAGLNYYPYNLHYHTVTTTPWISYNLRSGKKDTKNYEIRRIVSSIVSFLRLVGLI